MLSRRSYLVTGSLAAAALALNSRGRLPDHLLSQSTSIKHATGLGPLAASPDPAGAGLRLFALDLYRTLARITPSGNNLACSPYSAGVALAMTRAGARGTTAIEMDKVLHAPSPVPTALDTGMLDLAESMAKNYDQQTGDGANRPRLDVANSLWTQRGLTLNQAFLDTLSRYYSSTVQLADFATAPEAARQAINAWVSQRTNTKIPRLLAEGAINAATKLVLANALYLKASWQFPFSPKATAAASFKTGGDRSVSVPMMTVPLATLGYAAGDGWIALELPYVGSTLAMTVIVPTRGTLADLEATIDGLWLDKLAAAMKPEDVRLQLPRWTFRCPSQLATPLASLGMPTAFTDKADFSGITPQVALLISKVVQETFIAVDEKGTEAAAATAVIIRPPSVGPTPRPVTVDRAFLYMINDLPTGVPLFLGRVIDPTVTA